MIRIKILGGGWNEHPHSTCCSPKSSALAFLGAWEEEGEWKLIKKIDNNQNETCTQKCFLRFMHQMWNWYFLTLLTLNSDEFIVN